MRGVRARLTTTLVALVVLTALVLGVGSYVFVDLSLHERLLRDAEAQARFDLTAVIADRLPADPTREEVFDVTDILSQRGISSIVDLGDRDPITERFRQGLAPALRDIEPGGLAYEWRSVGPQPSLVIAGRLPSGGPTFYFVHDAMSIEAPLAALRVGLAGGGLLLALVALLAARLIARGVLAPVEAASRAAERIEQGDLSARVPAGSQDEFGRWGERFNGMADALQDTIEQLEAAQAQNRRFVADVAHELRTPLTALVAEASILREHLDALPPDARRTGELLVADVARLRTLVEELMELSRFDASAEEVRLETVDLARVARAIVSARAPGVPVTAAEEVVWVETEPRRLERILGNLLDNAREHAPGAPVEVRVRARDGWAYVEVLDRGPGVPPDRIGHIFERFSKVEPSRRGGSSGLGLAIAAEHAAVLGGQLRAFPRREGGLRMALRLPVTEPLPGRDGPATPEDEARIPLSTTRESMP
jgi:signal transduction histidine kinase